MQAGSSPGNSLSCAGARVSGLRALLALLRRHGAVLDHFAQLDGARQNAANAVSSMALGSRSFIIIIIIIIIIVIV